MQPGQFLINTNREKRKILGVCGEVVFLSKANFLDEADGCGFTEKELKIRGWSLLEEPWAPTQGCSYYQVLTNGNIIHYVNEYDVKRDEKSFATVTGNIHRTREDAVLYRQKLIETMGRGKGLA